MTNLDVQVSTQLKRYLGDVQVPQYDEAAVTRRASESGARKRRNRRAVLTAILFAIPTVIALAIAQPQARHALAAWLTSNKVTVFTHEITAVIPCKGKPTCRDHLRASLAQLPKVVPFAFVPPAGLPRRSTACALIFGGGLYTIFYCVPGGKGFDLSLMRYQPGVYHRGLVSSIRLPGAPGVTAVKKGGGVKMTWIVRHRQNLYLWVTGDELVMANLMGSELTEVDADRIMHAMHGSPLTKK